VALAAIASACGGGGSDLGSSASTEPGENPAANQAVAFHPDGWDGAELPPLGLYDPVADGEPTPDGFRQLLNRDAIFPVYRPTFLRADQIDWPDDEAVIGVDLEGEARAYPVGFLNRREIVVDMHRGIPTFVTW
jgi:hypothetical protein